VSACTCPFRATKRHEYGCSLQLDCAEGSLCNKCDLPIKIDDDTEGADRDDLCYRCKSYCTNKGEHVDWRLRALRAEAVIVEASKCRHLKCAEYQNDVRSGEAFYCSALCADLGGNE